MVTIAIRVQGQANRAEVTRIVGPSRVVPKGAYLYANIERREEAHLLTIELNNLYGVNARVLELTDGHGAA